MASTRRREREVVAVAFNQKEQRVLEKSLATIKLEASYSLKLLDLHNRAVKVHFRQMKDKVSRIKSHLAPDEIHQLRTLEAEGKLQPMYTPVSLGSALKIAAAARRLNSSHGRRSPGKDRAKSALPRVNLPDQDPSQGLAPPPGVLKRSNSVSGAFIDAPTSPRIGSGRPGSASIVIDRPATDQAVGVNGRGPQASSGESRVKSLRGSKRLESTKLNGGTGLAGGGGGVGVGSGGGSRLLHVGPGAGGMGLAWEEGSSARGEATRPGSSGVRQSSSVIQLQQPSQHNGLTLSSSSMDSQQSRSTSALHNHPSGPAASDSKARPGSQMNGHPGLSIHPSQARTRKSSASTSHSQPKAAAGGSHSHAPFSSHVVTEKEAREKEDNEAGGGGGGGGGAWDGGGGTSHSLTTPRSLEKNSSFLGLNDDTVDDLGEDLYAERRAELLEEEQYRAAAISKRKDRFLKEIDHYLQENPPLASLVAASKTSSKDKAEADKKGAKASAENSLLHGTLIRRRKVAFDSSPTYLPEMDYRDRLMGLWRDMNKCRYLRVPDEMIDLSGINTLAADNMKLYQVLKQKEINAAPANAWVE